jgi:OMF family outer membrane factor
MRSLMLAIVLAASPGTALADSLDPSSEQLPNAINVKGPRPKSNPEVVSPAATTLPAELDRLQAPAPLALPTTPSQVRIVDYRPLKLNEVERLIEVNSPQLKAIASQVEQAKSNLRAQISAWYPTLNFSTEGFPSRSFSNRNTNLVTQNNQNNQNTYNQSRVNGALGTLRLNWDLINPQRVPQIAVARDQFEKAKNQYLISLRELRLQAATAYFSLQNSDDQVRIGKSAVQSSSVSLRDARARLQAGVATKLDVMEAETQLARDQQKLTDGMLQQVLARRELARLLDLPQNVTPTAADPSTLLGVWQPSLQESIVAAYAFREELSNLILDVSIANSNANNALGNIQPTLSIFSSSLWGKLFNNASVSEPANTDSVIETLTQQIGLNLKWNLFDGGRSAAQARQQRQLATENTYKFSSQRDQIRYDVEQAYYTLQAQIRNLITTSRQVLSTRESLRLARLRFQAGVGTQRNVVDSQRDATTAEVEYSNSVSKYNTNVAQLRRRTGLDQVLLCTPTKLPALPPNKDSITEVPVIPVPTTSPCLVQAVSR